MSMPASPVRMYSWHARAAHAGPRPPISSQSMMTGMFTASTKYRAMATFSGSVSMTPGLPSIVPNVTSPPRKMYSKPAASSIRAAYGVGALMW